MKKSKPYPKCQIEKKDGSLCMGSVVNLPSGELADCCAGHLRRRRAGSLVAELAARGGDFDPADVALYGR